MCSLNSFPYRGASVSPLSPGLLPFSNSESIEFELNIQILFWLYIGYRGLFFRNQTLHLCLKYNETPKNVSITVIFRGQVFCPTIRISNSDKGLCVYVPKFHFKPLLEQFFFFFKFIFISNL